jgi:hypothetical protein
MQRPKLRAPGRWRIVAACGLIALLSRPGWAASLSPQDLQVLGNALAFVQPRPTGEGSVAVVYDGRNSLSRQDAEAILTVIGKSLTASGAVLMPKLVDTDELGVTAFSLVIVATGANSEAVARATSAHHALCVTADQAAVQQGVCTMAIRSTGRVEIMLNYQSARASGIGFATAFRMMVHEL